MDREERIYRALGGRSTDRVPTLSLLADPNITNQVLGLKPLPVLKFLNSDPGARYVDRRAAAISRYFDLGLFFFSHQVALINRRLGFDGVLFDYWPFHLRNHSELGDAFGRVYEIVDDGYGNPYMMYREGLIHSAEQWRSWPRPSIAVYASKGAWMYRVLRMIWKKRIAVIPWVAPGLWENCWQPMGLSRFVALMRRDPGFVREMIGYYSTLTVAAIDAYCSAGARVVGIGDDLGYKTGPMLSPEKLEDFFGESYRQITSTAHRYGSRIFIHCCGNTNDLVEKFVEWGFDGAHAFEPTAMNDLAVARQKVGGDLCFIGNIDVTHTLVDATREEVERDVRRAVEDSRGGGFILAPAHTHASIDTQNVRWMLEEAARIEP